MTRLVTRPPLRFSKTSILVLWGRLYPDSQS